jgi:hypothetical protein
VRTFFPVIAQHAGRFSVMVITAANFASSQSDTPIQWAEPETMRKTDFPAVFEMIWDPEVRLQKLKVHRQAVLSTAAGISSFTLVWCWLSNPWTVAQTLKHLAAFPNCFATEMVGLAPANKGQPGYWSHNDPEGDGV